MNENNVLAGLSSEEKLHGVKYIIESFVGCIRNITLSSGKSASDLLPITPLVATKHENVNEGCDNKCYSRYQNLCFYGSRCINHYNDISCDCFGLKYEGEHCDIYSKCFLFFHYIISPWPNTYSSYENLHSKWTQFRKKPLRKIASSQKWKYKK